MVSYRGAKVPEGTEGTEHEHYPCFGTSRKLCASDERGESVSSGQVTAVECLCHYELKRRLGVADEFFVGCDSGFLCQM